MKSETAYFGGKETIMWIDLDVDLFNLDLVFLGTKSIQLIANHDFCFSFEDLVAILGTEYNVIGT
jgi:hypothetical protein